MRALKGISSICSYCSMTGFKDWKSYKEHIEEELAHRHKKVVITPEKKKEIVERVEAKLAKYILKPKNTCQVCGPTESDGFHRLDGNFLCEPCLSKAAKGEITIC